MSGKLADEGLHLIWLGIREWGEKKCYCVKNKMGQKFQEGFSFNINVGFSVKEEES